MKALTVFSTVFGDLVWDDGGWECERDLHGGLDVRAGDGTARYYAPGTWQGYAIDEGEA